MISSPDEQYLTVKELSNKIKFSRQTIYNMIHKGDFVKGRHYIKPCPKKVLFLWSAVQAWMEAPDKEETTSPKPSQAKETKTHQSLINI